MKRRLIMTWMFSEPTFGDLIRVKYGEFWHYGIYADDNEIIQFGYNPAGGLIPPEEVKVLSTNIDEFLLGGFLEVAQFDKKELKKKRNPTDTVNIARSRIGEAGYHILQNNCEHFANECVFGEHKSKQVDSVRNFLKKKLGYMFI